MITLINPDPNFGFVCLTDNTATSDYNALQTKFERRLVGHPILPGAIELGEP